MNRFKVLLFISFAGSVASVFASRGVYFYTEHQFGFGDFQNLWAAFGSGIAYFIGAVPSHWLSVKLGERRLMVFAIILQIICLFIMFASPVPWVIVTGQIAGQFFNALMWPVVESYVSGGKSPRETVRSLGHFNVTWALATPLATLAIGPIIASMQSWLFAAGAIIFCSVFCAAMSLKTSVQHLAHDHPDRPPAERLERCRLLLISSRWLLAYSYSLLNLLVPVFPKLFETLGYGVRGSTALASITDTARWLTFIAMQFFAGWRDRADLLFISVFLLPASFLVILLVPHTGAIIAAELVFGIAEGLVYFAALYYAMVVKNAAVNAGGAHESLIGIGFAIGPAAGLIAMSIAGDAWKQSPTAMIAGIGPVMLVCTIGAIWPLVKLRK